MHSRAIFWSSFESLLFQLCVAVGLGCTAWAQESEPGDSAPVVQSTGNLREVSDLGHKINQLYNAGKLTDALKVGERLTQTLRLKGGTESDQLLQWMQWLAGAAELGGEWEIAVKHRSDAYDWAAENYGDDNWRTRGAKFALEQTRRVAALPDEQHAEIRLALERNSQVKTLFDAGKQVDALRLAQQVSDTWQRILGDQHPHYAHSLDSRASLHYAMADYAQAEPLYVEAMTIKAKTLGKQHPNYARSVGNLANLYWSMGDYTRAEPLYVETKEIFGKTLGNDHPYYARSLNNLALLYKSVADYARAEPLYVESKAIAEKALGKEHLSYATSLNNLANLYRDMGDYARADPLYVESKAIKAKTLGIEHPSYATSLNNRAKLYELMGDYTRAEPLYVQSRSIREKTLGKEHPDYALSLNNLAMLYKSMAEYARAEPLYIESKSIREKTLGKKHPDYATSLNDLAELYWSMQNYQGAEPLYVASKAIREQTLGKEHPEYAMSLNNLARLYESMGDYARAEPLYVESQAIYEMTLGTQHPYYAANRNNLAGLYELMGDYARAAPLYEQAIEITLKNLDQTACILSERQQMVMNQSVRYQLDSYVNCCLEGSLPRANAVALVVLWKGSILKRQHDLRMAADDPKIADQFRQLQSSAQQLSAHTRATPDPKQLKFWNQRLGLLTEEKEQLESQLMRSSAAFREANEKVSFEQIRATIPEDAVLIDYLEYNSKHGRSILASLIRRDGEPVMLDLGSAARAGEAIDCWRESFGMSPESRMAGQQLRQQIWQPLLARIEDANLILVSTDGVLGRIPLGALPGKNPDSYLIEDHRLALIPVPQLLPALVHQPSARTGRRELLLIGDVDYDSRPGAQQQAAVPTDTPSRKRPWERGTLGQPVRGSETWGPLSETRVEVEFIAGLYRRLFQPAPDAVLDLRQSAATETAFRQNAGQCMYLHLATHGFFAAPELKSGLSPEMIAQRGQDGAMMISQEREVIRGHNPGQLSGLVFAGANHPPTIDLLSDSPPDDGIMTADEIAFLPLGGVQLVVLSACETGLGEVAGGEGLLGIQRGFQVAGARSTIASLWKVNDAAARHLMQEFYTNYLDKEMSMLDAVRETQLWALNNAFDAPRGTVRKTKPFAEAPDKPRRLSPQYWAPFVLSGDWR